MPEDERSFGVGDCVLFNLNDLELPGDGIWCKNIIKINQRVEIAGVGYFMEQKVPFELLIVRETLPPPQAATDI